MVKKKQGNQETKRPQSSRAKNVGCTATIHLRLESWRIESPTRDKFNSRIITTTNDQELLELLADRAKNPDYDYIAKYNSTTPLTTTSTQ
ncbi:hypothetical protein RhiirA5_421662 [Rhizophagus irregularis]|uniref:Uncharacterized protein n=2 Tax=Rhizophagus irregularis TaxID=588596 RepID=U9TX09_RHIID|nr:hypothetical protein GLOIN_2v1763797 [Rhizophagus irregularis DAOM 181602=DAOM 197198]PKC04861.1 hypothetical protein RhiirA5_421662 [Rhizophagus irregularis]PKY27833.1 hypothetical protein RhiirB3_443703 [Rhizophagus irregularis]POG81169.1 hypothetical protein GLOIN_2v1763797 [Rhizophagus irregularis DAOM 181602=DAOM 197198]UZO07990.1 hypothetical protein OCT59_028258 [Rhizophagus irregularis]CAB4473190.1 unnamed protein product [Rhizophagus irregularis]|eukprot:XP_025188035.1 hypothetical protein GLOIN_2v1763797 [Rhizophagus irregularis DAOM 181602=DAOM 197198]